MMMQGIAPGVFLPGLEPAAGEVGSSTCGNGAWEGKSVFAEILTSYSEKKPETPATRAKREDSGASLGEPQSPENSEKPNTGLPSSPADPLENTPEGELDPDQILVAMAGLNYPNVILQAVEPISVGPSTATAMTAMPGGDPGNPVISMDNPLPLEGVYLENHGTMGLDLQTGHPGPGDVAFESQTAPLEGIPEDLMLSQRVPDSALRAAGAGIGSKTQPEAEVPVGKGFSQNETSQLAGVPAGGERRMENHPVKAAEKAATAGEPAQEGSVGHTLSFDTGSPQEATAGGSVKEFSEGKMLKNDSPGTGSGGSTLTGGSGEVAVQAKIPLEANSVQSQQDFIDRLSQVLKDQMVARSKLISQNGKTEIRLELKPEYLGKLLVRLSLENGVISARFLVESHQVRSIIENNMAQLKQNLSEQGIPWQETSVDVGGSGSDLLQENNYPGSARKSASHYSASPDEGMETDSFSWRGIKGASISYLA